MSKRMIDQIGGEDALRKLVGDFYDFVETLPEANNLKRLHMRGHGIAHARVELFNFMSGFLAGRRYFEEKHGHTNVRLVHAHVPITVQDAESWLTCMDAALLKNGLDGPEIDQLRETLRRICMVLVNDLGEWGMPHFSQRSQTPSSNI
ncbi:MAG: group II truncated hemoglobin [Albidovulum sp.]